MNAAEDFAQRGIPITPTAELVAERTAALDAIEADRYRFDSFLRAWGKIGAEWTVWRAADGTLDFDLNVAGALVDAAYWTEAAAWWKEKPESFAQGVARDCEDRARTPWLTRTPVAVVRGTGMREPPTADHGYGFSVQGPVKGGVTRFVHVTAAGIVASPGDKSLGYVELLK